MKHFIRYVQPRGYKIIRSLEYNRPQGGKHLFCMTIRAGVDFGLLKHCIQMEYARQESLRIRFTARDEHGKVFQYFASYDPRDIRLVDFREKRRRKSTQRWRNGPVNL